MAWARLVAALAVVGAAFVTTRAVCHDRGPAPQEPLASAPENTPMRPASERDPPPRARPRTAAVTPAPSPVPPNVVVPSVLTDFQRQLLDIATWPRAAALRSALESEIERRGSVLGECAGRGGLAGEAEVAVAFTVSSRTKDADIRDVQFVRVVRGAPVDDSVARCLVDALAPARSIVSRPSMPFATFDGPVEVQFRLAPPPDSHAE